MFCFRTFYTLMEVHAFQLAQAQLLYDVDLFFILMW